MARYTSKALQQDLKEINVMIQKATNGRYFLEAQSRNGYTGLDLYRMEGDRRKCERNIQCGSPRECLEAAESYKSGVLESHLMAQEG